LGRKGGEATRREGESGQRDVLTVFEEVQCGTHQRTRYLRIPSFGRKAKRKIYQPKPNHSTESARVQRERGIE